MVAEAEVQDKKESVNKPLNGAEYLDSLKDDREIWIYGERVKDVTTHPAFRNTVRMVARLYDALHDPKTKDVRLTDTDTGSGGKTHHFFRASRSAEEYVAARDAIAQWQRLEQGLRRAAVPEFQHGRNPGETATMPLADAWRHPRVSTGGIRSSG